MGYRAFDRGLNLARLVHDDRGGESYAPVVHTPASVKCCTSSGLEGPSWISRFGSWPTVWRGH